MPVTSLELVWAALLLAIGTFPSNVCAQVEVATTATSDREEIYENLAAQVAGLEKHGHILKQVVKLTRPTVVHIEAQKYDGGREVEEAGSGIIIQIDKRYYVITNSHVIQHSTLQSIRVRLADGRALRVVDRWTDRGSDVAVIAVAAKNLVTARLGDSSHVEIGDFVLAVGSPFGLSHSVTYGIVSAKGRRDLLLGDDGEQGVRLQNFLQTDAAINPGNSGGPLLNLRGEVIGINTAIASNSGGNEGIGFSIPINMAMLIATQLIDHGAVNHGYLGVRLDDEYGPERALQLGLPQFLGALVKSITPRSPAEFAKLRANDVIVQYNSTDVEDDNHLVNLVSLSRIGEEVDLVLIRSSKYYTVRVKLGDRSEFENES